MTKAAELAKMGEVLTNSQIGGRRNMIINGAMQVAQRGTSQASITSTGYYTIDRWQVAITNGGTWTMSQDTDVPTGEGFANSLKMDCTTADTSFGASDSLYVRTKLESQDCQNMKKGTSNAEKVTLKFWVKSSKTGTHIVELLDNDNSRFVSLAYTISSANTWENHTLTFPADTTGAFADDNGVGLGIHWYMGAGSNISSGTLGTTWHTTQANRAAGQVNLADSTDNNWYITGIQLEVGEQATPFEHRSYGEELALCHRYCNALLKYGTGSQNDNRLYNADYVNVHSFVRMGYPRMRDKPDISYTISAGAAETDYSSNGLIQIFNDSVTNWFIYDVLLESEL
jgi:hypothetical protein